MRKCPGCDHRFSSLTVLTLTGSLSCPQCRRELELSRWTTFLAMVATISVILVLNFLLRMAQPWRLLIVIAA